MIIVYFPNLTYPGDINDLTIKTLKHFLMSPKFNLEMEDESVDIKIGFSGDIKIGPFQKLKKKRL